MSYRPVDALDAQLNLIRWYTTDEAAEYMVQHGTRHDDEDPTDPIWWENILGHKGDWMTHNGSWLDEAETYAITPDMQTLLLAASRTAPEDPLRASDIPTRRGFLYIGSPGFLIPGDARARHAIWPFAQDEGGWGEGYGKIFYISAVGWNQDAKGITYAIYIDPKPFDEYLIKNKRTNPFPKTTTLQLFDVRRWDYDLAWFYDREDYENRDGTGAEERHRHALEEYAAVHGMTMSEIMEGACDGAEMFYRRLLLSFFRLVFQRVSVPHREFLGRAAARRAERSSLTAPDPGTITVIKLRREYSQPTESYVAGSVDWSHRWMVTGHWRNQWYPSLGRHQQKYIPAYVKGPSDKPFVAKDRIWNLER